MKQDGSLGQRAGQRAIRMMGFIKVLIDRLIVANLLATIYGSMRICISDLTTDGAAPIWAGGF